MFPRLSYLEWMAGRPEAVPYDLGTSGLQGDRPDGDVVVPEPLEDLPDAPAGATLENLVATEYDVHPEQVLLTAGATHANFIAFAAALDAADGDEIAVEAPAYQPLVGTPMGLGASVEQFDRGPAGELDLDAMATSLGEDTALVTLTNRHNPTGYLASVDDLAEAAAVAGDAGAPLLVDEVYAPYVLDAGAGPLGGPSVAGRENAVVTGSLTKFMGLGDLRIGWLVGPPAFVERARQIAPHVPDVAGPSRVLARRALYGADELVSDQRDLLAANDRALSEFVEDRDDFAGTVHEGASFGFFEPTATSVAELVGAAWEEGVLVVPGRFFDDQSRVRVSAGRSPTDVAVSLARLGQVLTDVGRAP
ncbi:MAG: pyridoxal phosphate-dependent aminotransferase [Haloferacaceae archaeon]